MSTPSQRLAVAEALGSFAAEVSVIATALLDVEPAGVLAVDPARPDSGATSAVVMQHRAVAADHLRSFVHLLECSEPHAASLATLVRSSLETWSRAWWILSAPSAAQAEYRRAAMIVDELQAAGRRGITLMSGTSIADAVTQATAARDAVPGHLPEPVPRYSSLAAELLRAAGDSDPIARYSHLSGIAHGESIFTASLSDLPLVDDGTRVAVGLPLRNLVTYSTAIFGSHAIGFAKVLGEWGAPDDVAGGFAAALTTVHGKLSGIDGFA